VKKLSLTLTLAMMALMLRPPGQAAASEGSAADAEQETAALAAQGNAAEAVAHSPAATHTCMFNFTTGAGDTLLTYCVTANGNIAHLETPQSIEHIAVGTIGEGYGICDAGSNTRYFDYADFGDSGNWLPPTVLQQNATTVKIARTTSDGIYTLTQTITEVPGILPWVRVAMTLKNNSAIHRAALLVRYADVDSDGLALNNFDTTVDSAFGWNSLSGGDGFGLEIQNVGKAELVGPLAFSHPQGPDPCDPTTTPVLQTGTDGSIGIL